MAESTATERPFTTTDYRDFYRTGPDTPTGRWFRTFWHPVSLSEDVPAGRAKPVRIMGEDLTLFRGETTPSPLVGEGWDEGEDPGAGSVGASDEGRPPSLTLPRQGGGNVHLLAFRCAHRGTQLSTGWVEGDHLRCFYHGWMYDGSGQCVEQPAEPEPFCQKIRIKSYPVQEYLGLIFAYLGEGEPPPLPRYPDFEIEGLRQLTFRKFPYNVVNNLDGHPDHAHLPFVHGQGGRQWRTTGEFGIREALVDEDEFGLSTPEGGGQFGMPNVIIRIAPGGPRSGDVLQWRVPIDDESHASFNLVFWPGLTDEDAADIWRTQGPSLTDIYERGIELGRAILRGELRIEEVEASEPRAYHALVQDVVSQMGLGTIPDSVPEHMGREDAGLILKRTIWEREIRALAEGRPLKLWHRPERLQRPAVHARQLASNGRH